MKRVMRQVFGSTRPKDIWLDLWTFDRLNAQALVHIVYWAGLSLLLIAAFGVAGVAVGNALADGSLWGYVLALPMVVIGWLGVIIGIVLWRVLCEFILSVMGIAEDLRVLRQYQEKLAPMEPQAPVQTAVQPSAPVAVESSTADAFAPEPALAASEDGNILEDPFFRPRFEKPEA
jgi:hypothetical protein